jgi:ATP-dependent DNA helicase RecG
LKARTEGMSTKSRMRNALKQEGFPEPEIKSESFFFITFKRVYNVDLLSRKPEAGIEKTTQKTTQKILELMQKKPTIARTELAIALKLTPDGIKWHLAKLKAQGRVRRIGPDKGGHWEVLG